ncbi:MAG: hypothetical protein WC530_08395 [Candidatus Omnitrophota bacterium]
MNLFAIMIILGTVAFALGWRLKGIKSKQKIPANEDSNLVARFNSHLDSTMNNKTFFKITALIILAGIILFLATPKYTFNSNGTVRKNVFTGTVRHIGGYLD